MTVPPQQRSILFCGSSVVPGSGAGVRGCPAGRRGGALAGFLLGAGYGVALMIGGRASRSSQIPFGPFMVAGAFLVVLVSSF
jgi:hypothetical protein